MPYATVIDIQARMTRDLTEREQDVCAVLLEDAASLIDSYNSSASDKVKKTVSCRMIVRALGDGDTAGVPIGASQGSMSALGYSQSWTISGGSAGELYLSKAERRLLGLGSRIGSYSPIEEMASKGGVL
jgi:hypothetical protein